VPNVAINGHVPNVAINGHVPNVAINLHLALIARFYLVDRGLWHRLPGIFYRQKIAS
jgi:hypothetical protein